MNSTPHHVLRTRSGHARVTNAELFFDLIYAFSVTQISHFLLHDLSPAGAFEALLLWFAVWLGWQYTAWVTNWFDPDTQPIRLLLFGLMALGLLMASAVPQAFGERALVFAGAYVAIQVGRSLYALMHLGSAHALTPNFRRILGWVCISAVFWIGGAVAEGGLRLALWAVAVLCEYVSPMFGFALPGLGRSRTSDWTIDGGHLAERCQLFVVLALGECIIVTGATLADAKAWDAPILIAVLIAFIGSVAMWWMYFDTSSGRSSHVIEHAQDPGRMGAYFHYVHVLLIAGVIVSAVANDLTILHPDHHMETKYAAVLLGGPALYLLGNTIFKRIVDGRFPPSHTVGLGLLALLVPVAFLTDLLMVGGLTTGVMVLVAAWETVSRRHAQPHPNAHPH